MSDTVELGLLEGPDGSPKGMNDHVDTVGVDARTAMVGALCKLGTSCDDSSGTNSKATKLAGEGTKVYVFDVPATRTINLSDVTARVSCEPLGSLYEKAAGTVGASDSVWPCYPPVEEPGALTCDAIVPASGGYGDMTALSACHLMAVGTLSFDSAKTGRMM